jgi:hypothetical protein
VFGSKTVAPTSPALTKGLDRLTETWDSARATLAPHVGAARDAVAPHLDDARARVAPVVETAVERLTPTVERIAPAVETAVDTARTRLREDVVPAVTAAVETARESSAPARAEAKERAALALLALQGRQQKVRRWPVALVSLAAGAAAGVAAAAFTRRASSSAPAVTPTPFPAAPAGGDEPAGSAPVYPAGQPGSGTT